MNGSLGHVKKVQNDYNKEVPLSIIGHSMGGLITVHAAMAEPDLFKCIVLMGPLITMDPTLVTPFKKVLAGVFSGLLPSFAIGQKIVVHILTLRVNLILIFFHLTIFFDKKNSSFCPLKFLLKN